MITFTNVWGSSQNDAQRSGFFDVFPGLSWAGFMRMAWPVDDKKNTHTAIDLCRERKWSWVLTGSTGVLHEAFSLGKSCCWCSFLKMTSDFQMHHKLLSYKRHACYRTLKDAWRHHLLITPLTVYFSQCDPATDGFSLRYNTTWRNNFEKITMCFELPKSYYGGFLKWGTPKSSIYRWIFHEINHPASLG
jgi:hypothetical protein